MDPIRPFSSHYSQSLGTFLCDQSMMDVNMGADAPGSEDAVATAGGAVAPRQSREREKAFACTHPGCTKRFTRAEHLQRHALNHVPGAGAACPLCRAHFKRPDLLNRHMERHQQKDIEAGGPGCGVLDTRKRAWQDPDGTIKETNPRARSSGRVRKATKGAGEDTQQQQQQQQQQHRRQQQQQPSPASELEGSPSSTNERGHPPCNHSKPQGDTSHNYYHGPAPGPRAQGPGVDRTATSLDHGNYAEQLDFTFSVPDFPATDAQYDELDYDQIFQPDTASSFNMPYTTASDYGWLFNSGKSTASIPIPQRGASVLHNLGLDTQPQQPFNISPTSTSSQLWSLPSDSGFGDGSGAIGDSHSCDSGQGSPPQSLTHLHHQASLSSISLGSLPLQPGFVAMPGNDGSGAPGNSHLLRAQASQVRKQQKQTSQKQQQPSETQRIHIAERPFSTLDGNVKVPIIEEEIRKTILEVIASSGPSLPSGPDVSVWQVPLLSLDSLQDYLQLFFTRFNTAYPLIHLPTFSPAKTEPLLLIAILLLGATYSTKDAHQVAVCIHDVLRPRIFAHAGFSAKPQLWSLQTILLVECFGKSRAGLKQHEMSHLFHGLLINLIRRSDCQSVKPAGPSRVSPQPGYDEDNAWHQWASQEEKKRLALFCFMWDTQHAVLFCQSLCMSSFELRVDLPCPQAIWEASDSASWASTWRATPATVREVPYLLALKSYLNPTAPRSFSLDAMSRVLVLHGLMSVAWDMQRRDQTSLGMSPVQDAASQPDWKRTIGEAYSSWQRDFDVHCATAVAHMRNSSMNKGSGSNTDSNFGDHLGMSSSSSVNELRTRCDAMWSFAASYSALSGCAQILLNMDFLDVQVYAGSRQILGRPVQQKDYIRSAAIVKKWAAAPRTETPVAAGNRPAMAGYNESAAEKHSATIAATHAALNLHRHMDHLTRHDSMSLFHVPWCIYLMTLTLWASQHARSLEAPVQASLGAFGVDGDDEMVWDAQAEMQGLLLSLIENDGAPPKSGAAKRRTNGLVWIMTETLTKVRWGIIHGAVSVLKGLVPQRLIHRYDEPVDSKEFGCV